MKPTLEEIKALVDTFAEKINALQSARGLHGAGASALGDPGLMQSARGLHGAGAGALGDPGLQKQERYERPYLKDSCI